MGTVEINYLLASFDLLELDLVQAIYPQQGGRTDYRFWELPVEHDRALLQGERGPRPQGLLVREVSDMTREQLP